ncbi:MAG: sulfurtransferase, partial [SAR202 cluster bacterium]|nr:sulfurtransferase [SAR202 cluster bacterium]
QGHIPGAVQIDWRDNVKPDGTFKSARELRTLYQGRGITRDREITTYCNNGARAAHAAFALTLLGYPRIRVYYGSMLDYGQRQAPQER